MKARLRKKMAKRRGTWPVVFSHRTLKAVDEARQRVVMVPRRYTMTQLMAGALHQPEAGARMLVPGTLLPQPCAWRALAGFSAKLTVNGKPVTVTGPVTVTVRTGAHD